MRSRIKVLHASKARSQVFECPSHGLSLWLFSQRRLSVSNIGSIISVRHASALEKGPSFALRNLMLASILTVFKSLPFPVATLGNRVLQILLHSSPNSAQEEIRLTNRIVLEHAQRPVRTRPDHGLVVPGQGHGYETHGYGARLGYLEASLDHSRDAINIGIWVSTFFRHCERYVIGVAERPSSWEVEVGFLWWPCSLGFKITCDARPLSLCCVWLGQNQNKKNLPKSC